MEVVVASHPSSLLHDTGAGHPESPDRVRAVRQGIEAAGVPVIEVEAPLVSLEVLTLAHDASYVGMLQEFCALGGGLLDMDTVASPQSWEAALTAVGAVVALVDELSSREDATGFAITRPPGHHATRRKAMGFCLLNNVAAAAMSIRSRGDRVAIVDWDVHHGNGTQEIVSGDPGVLYVSIHQSGHYPSAGLIEDVDAEAPGTNVNIPVPAGTAGDVYRVAWDSIVVPIVSQFRPDWVLVSAGYDAHRDDPLAGLRLTSADFGWLAARLADVQPPHRIVVALEGGYDMAGLRESAAATVQGLAGIRQFEESGLVSPPSSQVAVSDAARAMGRHWPL